MKKHMLIIAAIMLHCSLIIANPVLTKEKYLIATLYDWTLGTVSQVTGDYQLIYDPNKNETSAKETDFWIIKNIRSNQYTFQNAGTKKYLRYNPASTDPKKAFEFCDTEQSDKTTNFTLEVKTVNNLSYYLIRSIANPSKILERNTSPVDGVYPVGVKEGEAANNNYFIFYDINGGSATDDGKVSIVGPVSKPSLGSFAAYADSLTFNDKKPVPNTSKKEFFLSVTEFQMGTDVKCRVRYKMKNAAHKLYIDSKLVENNTDYTFSKVSSSVNPRIEIRDGINTISSGSIIFTCLPLVQMFYDGGIGSAYVLGRLVVTEPDKSGPQEVLLSSFKTRGAYSGGLAKHAYAFKLKDMYGEEAIDRSFFGLRSDNNWILDAMYIDPGRMRNRVSTDLWNAFSTKPYYYADEPKMVNGTRGNYIEVFCNDSYNGLYCMTEKIDRKQLNLKKLKYSADSTVVTQRGALYKADDWTREVLLGGALNGSTAKYTYVPAYDNKSDTWQSYEVKHPDLDDNEPISWKPLYDLVYFTSSLTNDTKFIADVSKNFDLPNFLDYYLFIELLLTADNQAKNTYLSVYDQSVSPMFSITPWDLDASWGRRWNGSSNVTGPNQNFDNFCINFEHGQSNLFLRLRSLNYDGYLTKLKNRYKGLRGTYFSHNHIMSRFERYVDISYLSGAAGREESKWGIAKIRNELDFLSTWITARLAYLDNQYLGGPYVTDVPGVTVKHLEVYPNPATDIIFVDNVSIGETVQLISLQGNIIQRIVAESERINIDISSLKPGVYLIKAGESTMKVVKK